MKFFSASVFLAAVLAVQATHEINQTQYGQTRIIAGRPAVRGQFPHQAGILLHKAPPNNGMEVCGGALINHIHILTAAHCIHGANRWTVYLGTVNVANPVAGQIKMDAQRVIYHPRFDPITLNNDIGLLELPQPVEFSVYIRPIRLPRRSEVSDLNEYIKMYISGFGKIADSSEPVPTLNWAEVVTISNDVCAPKYEPGLVTPSVICILGERGQSTCQGDSGGALIRRDADGAFTHIGISSFVDSDGCTVGTPAGFTRTAHYLDWIFANTGLEIRP